ncbi:MAG: DUF167 domain-containing protein [Candidatus Omnitrophota bacterium]
MKISVKVKPNSKKPGVEIAANNEYILRVREKALDGRANAAAIKLLSEYSGVPKAGISIIKGHTCRNKIIRIDK